MGKRKGQAQIFLFFAVTVKKVHLLFSGMYVAVCLERCQKLR